MASIFKRTRRKPIPATATIVTWKGKPCAEWRDATTGRKQRAALNAAGNAILVQDDCYTIAWFDQSGKRRRKGTGTSDHDAAMRLASNLETQVMLRWEGIIDATQERLSTESRRLLKEHLNDYEAKLRSSGCDGEYVANTMMHLRSVCTTCGFATVGDVAEDAVNRLADQLREQGKSARTVHAYLTSIKGFTRWLVAGDKLASDPLRNVKKPNPKTDRKHQRRMLLPDEWQWLRSVALAEDADRFGIPAAERVLLYATAIQTGLRSSELRSLTRGKLYLEAEAPFIVCSAGSTKNRKPARQYVQSDLAAQLREHVATKAPKAPLFTMPEKSQAADMLRADLGAARKAWLQKPQDASERMKREQSDFLTEANHEGERLDFHALRHTCGAWAAMSGAHPKAVQSLMRHSTITLTMDTYGHLFPGQEALTVANLPKMMGDEPERLRATGTLGAHFGQQSGCFSVQTAEMACDAVRSESQETSSPKCFPISSLGDGAQSDATECDRVTDGTRTRDFQIHNLAL